MTEGMLEPGPENFAAFMALPNDQVIHMVNFLRYRDEAAYPEGHEHHGKGWSGRRAYEEYARCLGPIFQRIGARVVWRGAFQTTMIGSPQERWDDLLIAEYPDSRVFLAMVADPEYQAVGINRTAALADSRLFRTHPAV